METRIRQTKLISLITATLAAAAIWIAWPASWVQAVQDSEEKPSPMGIAVGQTLYLNVANTGRRNAIPIEMKILDDDGNPLAAARQLVLPGHTASLSLNRDDIPGRAASRVLTRAEVSTLGGPDTRNLVLSEEVVDNETQKTMILHPGISKGFNPQPDPPGHQH